MTPLSRLGGCFLILTPLLSHSAEGGVKRNPAVVKEFKRTHICPSTGTYTQRCKGFVVDHIVALKCGGPDSVLNMQYQTVEDAKAKDRWELIGCVSKKDARQ